MRLVNLTILCFLRVTNAAHFYDISYNDLNENILKLRGDFSNVLSANELWPHKMQEQSCSPLIIKIGGTFELTDKLLPQLLISGELHGDERVGPLASLYMSQLLVHAASCQINGQMESCDFIFKQNISNTDMIWLAFLATKRQTIVVPATNCVGYMQNTREEAGVDPNRDFPYSRNDNKCLRSNAARVIYELFIDYTVQLMVTFHGGMVAIGYEWGTENHRRPHDASPDHTAHKQIGHSMSVYAGAFRHEKAYPSGTMNSLVYPVPGGMEDWAYASGWDTSARRKCDGFTEEYVPDSRSVVFLVETSDMKRPQHDSLGQSEHVLSVNPSDANSYGGHVPRNVRLALLSIDIVQPYVCINEIEVSSRVISFIHKPKRQRLRRATSTSSSGSGTEFTGRFVVASTLQLSWYVGGAVTVDKSWLSWHQIPLHSEDENQLLQNSHNITTEIEVNLFPHVTPPRVTHEEYTRRPRGAFADSPFVEGLSHASGLLHGSGKWNLDGNDQNGNFTFRVADVVPPLPSEQSVNANRGRSFTERYWLVAWVQVDSAWGVPDQGYPSPKTPQSHIVNARTNADWVSKTKDGLVAVKGRLYWAADPVVVAVTYRGGDAKNSLVADMSVESRVLQCAYWNRYGMGGTRANRTSSSSPNRGDPDATNSVNRSFDTDYVEYSYNDNSFQLYFVMLCLMGIICLFIIILQHRRSPTR